MIYEDDPMHEGYTKGRVYKTDGSYRVISKLKMMLA